MKKYLFSDIDGTFLQGSFFSAKRKKFIPTDTLIDAVDAFVKDGNELIFATGRRHKSIRKLEAHTGLEANYAISMNGALVHGIDDVELRRVELMKSDVAALFHLLKKTHIYQRVALCTSYMDDVNIVVTKKHPRFFFRFLAKKLAGKIDRAIQSEIEKGEHNLIKIVLVGNRKLMEEARAEILRAALPFEVFKSSPYSLEICASGANKGDALAFVMEHKKAGVVAYVGDSENDIAGFKSADYRFAIEAGEETIFEHANYRVKTVEEALEILSKIS